MKDKGNTLLMAAAATAATLCLTFTPNPVLQAAPTDTITGTGCRAANLDQAFDLAWNHVRVHNESSVDRWVICPANINPPVYDDGDGASLYGPGSGSVTGWFGEDSAGDAEVWCIWREIPASTTGMSVTNFGTVTMSAEDPLPDTESDSMDLTAFNIFQTSTLTCRLSPGTGINSYQIIYDQEI